MIMEVIGSGRLKFLLILKLFILWEFFDVIELLYVFLVFFVFGIISVICWMIFFCSVICLSVIVFVMYWVVFFVMVIGRVIVFGLLDLDFMLLFLLVDLLCLLFLVGVCWWFLSWWIDFMDVFFKVVFFCWNLFFIYVDFVCCVFM